MSKDVGEIVDPDTATGKVLPKNTDSPQKKPKRKISEDGNIKRDIAYLQKKIADLEIGLSEIQEAAQKMDTSGLDALKQKVEDLEDLTMVENAGIVEIKKFLEGLQTEIESSLPQGVPEKLANLEEKVSALPDLSQLEAKISEQKSGTPEQTTELVQSAKEEFENRMTQMGMTITDLEKKIEGIDIDRAKEEIKQYIIPLIPEYRDFDVMERKLHDSVLSIKLEIKDYKRDFERLKNEIEEKLDSPLQTRVLKELEDMKNDSLVNNSKVDALDSFVKEVSKEVSELRPLINRMNSKIESFDGLGDLKRSVDDKLQEFREVLATADRLKEGDASLKELGPVVSRLREVEHKLTEMMTYVEEFEKSKEDISGLKWKTDYKKLVDDISRRFEKLRSETNVLNYSEEINEVKENVKAVNEIVSGFDRKIDRTEQMIKTMEDDMSILQGSQMSVEAKADKLTNLNTSELMKRIESLEEIVDNKLPHHETINKLEKRINEMEGKSGVDATTQMLNEIMERLVFLESRMAALEKTLIGGGGKAYPIILE